MRRKQLEHVLRAAATITGDPDVLVIGSQSILGAIPEQRLPSDCPRAATDVGSGSAKPLRCYSAGSRRSEMLLMQYR
jgi:hypothetical protein